MSGDVTWVAAAGFGLSVISLGTQAIGAIRNRSRLAVGIDSMGIAYSSNGAWVEEVEFTLTVQNLGKSPQTIWDAGLVEKGRKASGEISLRFTQRMQARSEKHSVFPEVRKRFAWIDGPAFPCQIPVGGVVEWVIGDAGTNGLDASTKWCGFADRFRARKPRRTRSKRYRARTQTFLPKE